MQHHLSIAVRKTRQFSSYVTRHRREKVQAASIVPTAGNEINTPELLWRASRDRCRFSGCGRGFDTGYTRCKNTLHQAIHLASFDFCYLNYANPEPTYAAPVTCLELFLYRREEVVRGLLISLFKKFGMKTDGGKYIIVNYLFDSCCLCKV